MWAQCFFQRVKAVLPVQKTVRICDPSKMGVKSLGMGFLMVASEAPSISQLARTSHIAMWCFKRKFLRSVIAAGMSGFMPEDFVAAFSDPDGRPLFLYLNLSPKTCAITFQNLFCGCM